MRLETFLCAILLLGTAISVKMTKRSGISDFERRLNVTPEEDPTAMMDSADNGKLNSRHRKSRDEAPESAEPVQ